MDLQCYENMPNEKTLDLPHKDKTKTLYKLARSKIFGKHYCCVYCGMMDFDGEWLQIHVKNFHDECGIAIPMYECKICKHMIMKNEIIKHIIQKHSKCVSDV